jgi:hypothetical protein
MFLNASYHIQTHKQLIAMPITEQKPMQVPSRASKVNAVFKAGVAATKSYFRNLDLFESRGASANAARAATDAASDVRFAGINFSIASQALAIPVAYQPHLFMAFNFAGAVKAAYRDERYTYELFSKDFSEASRCAQKAYGADMVTAGASLIPAVSYFLGGALIGLIGWGVAIPTVLISVFYARHQLAKARSLELGEKYKGSGAMTICEAEEYLDGLIAQKLKRQCNESQLDAEIVAATLRLNSLQARLLLDDLKKDLRQLKEGQKKVYDWLANHANSLVTDEQKSQYLEYGLDRVQKLLSTIHGDLFFIEHPLGNMETSISSPSGCARLLSGAKALEKEGAEAAGLIAEMQTLAESMTRDLEKASWKKEPHLAWEIILAEKRLKASSQDLFSSAHSCEIVVERLRELLMDVSRY